jgi:predicted HAD superfamily Cof-like phosphohydrolase
VKTFFDEVGDFHRKFDLPGTGGDFCQPMTPSVLRYRTEFLEEELTEFKLASRTNDVAGMLDALVDIAWVAMGTAHYMGAPFNEAWAEVFKANMKKIIRPPDVEHPRGPTETICKPPDWVPPNIAQVIEDHNTVIEGEQDQDQEERARGR